LIIGDHKKIWSLAKTIFGTPSLPPPFPPFPPQSSDFQESERHQYLILLLHNISKKGVKHWYLQLPPFCHYIGPPAPLQTEFSRFCKIKFLLEKETHKKNKESHLKELNKIFRMVWFAYVNFNKNTMKT